MGKRKKKNIKRGGLRRRHRAATPNRPFSHRRRRSTEEREESIGSEERERHLQNERFLSYSLYIGSVNPVREGAWPYHGPSRLEPLDSIRWPSVPPLWPDQSRSIKSTAKIYLGRSMTQTHSKTDPSFDPRPDLFLSKPISFFAYCLHPLITACTPLASFYFISCILNSLALFIVSSLKSIGLGRIFIIHSSFSL